MNRTFTSATEATAESAVAVDVVGYRFHPRDDELVNHYLRRKLLNLSTGRVSIPEIKVYSFDPWDLLGLVDNKLDEWIFYCYCPRDYKYVNSKRSNRTTKSGHWKPTGKIREVKIKRTKKKIGIKKTLVFYKKGKGYPRGIITEYVMHEYEYIADPNSPHKENFTLCKLKRKRDKRINKDHDKLDSIVTMDSSLDQCHPISDVEKTSPSYRGPNAFDCENQRPPLLGSNGCSNQQQTTCDSSEASHLVVSDFGNQMSPLEKGDGGDTVEQGSCEYSEANCMRVSDFLIPITPLQTSYQVGCEHGEANCLMASDSGSHVSPLKDDGCSTLLTPSSLESHSVFENDKLGHLMDSVSGISPWQTPQAEQPTPLERELYSSRAPSPEVENQKLSENPFLTATEWGDCFHSAFPEINPELVDLMLTYPPESIF
ncbi:unnamed protein product [Linum tenue]|uniref:NAC domain-containing protein n=1 Tax=Linum tenue TaxID=586396 RepID=A0AAV0HGT2_9ROSI|nr:unnamed protein product [Linum tenue]